MQLQDRSSQYPLSSIIPRYPDTPIYVWNIYYSYLHWGHTWGFHVCSYSSPMDSLSLGGVSTSLQRVLQGLGTHAWTIGSDWRWHASNNSGNMPTKIKPYIQEHCKYCDILCYVPITSLRPRRSAMFSMCFAFFQWQVASFARLLNCISQNCLALYVSLGFHGNGYI